MAVDKKRVIARLKALFPKANLSQKRLDAYADKLAPKPADDADDAAIDALINDYNEVIDFVAVAAEDDRVRTLEKKANEQKPNPQDPKEDPKPDDDAPAWAKTLLNKVEALEKGKVVENKQQSAQKAFEASEVLKGLKQEHKENWLKRIDINSEISFEDQVKSLETEFSDLTQTAANNQQHAGFPPRKTTSDAEPSKEDVESIVDDLI